MSLLRAVQKPTTLLRNRPRTLGAVAGLLALSYSGPIGPALVGLAKRHGQLPLLMHCFFAHPNDVPATVLETIVGNSGGGAFAQAAGNAKGYDPSEKYSKILVPIRAYFGERDCLVPPSDARFLRGTPVETSEILGVGHFAHIERPDLVLARLV